MTELLTGLGMLGAPDLDTALGGGRPTALANVSEAQFQQVAAAATEPDLRPLADAAFANGRAFLRAADGLRGRPPRRVEWKGPHRPPGYDLLPADLRVDHVYLVSCKYQSRLLANVSPAHVFDRLLRVRSGAAAVDWYAVVAPDAYRDLYEAVRAELDPQARQVLGGSLPARLADLQPGHRQWLAERCARRWPPAVVPVYGAFCAAVAEATAARWSGALPDVRDRQELLWRLLRLSDVPYFVLGTGRQGQPLRLRIGTPWDWRQGFRLRAFVLEPSPAGQPQVDWRADVLDVATGRLRVVRGHVEVRWSHGRFSGMPEAKVYLDTPHTEVPGYFPLDDDGDAKDHDDDHAKAHDDAKRADEGGCAKAGGDHAKAHDDAGEGGCTKAGGDDGGPAPTPVPDRRGVASAVPLRLRDEHPER